MDSIYVVNLYTILYDEPLSCVTWTIHKTEKGAIEMLKEIASDQGYELNGDGRSTRNREDEFKVTYFKIENVKLFD